MSTNAAVRKAAKQQRHNEDFYRTRRKTLTSLLDVEDFPHTIVEPCCGDGSISRVLIERGHCVISSDLIDRGYAPGGADFLQTQTRYGDALLTNPPFTLSDDFAMHAMALGYPKVALLGRLAWLEGARRFNRIYYRTPPVRVYVFSERQTLWRGDEEDGEKGGAIPFAWFVFELGNKALPTIDWLLPSFTTD